MKASRIIAIVAGVILALLLGFGVHQLLPAAPASRTIALGPLPGRGLQPPWWEAVSVQTASHTRTYVVPADVLFATGSSTISQQGQSVLDQLAPQLQGATAVTVAGCTDSVGGADSPYNVALGTRRAEAAISVLEAQGLPAAPFEAVSWADTHPVESMAGLDPATINALNRRIVITVTK